MKKYVTKQNIAALARIAVPCAFTLLVAGFSPATAATLSRCVDVSVTLSSMWSMIGPLLANRQWHAHAEEPDHSSFMTAGRRTK